MGILAGVYELAEACRYLEVTAPGQPPRYRALHRWVRTGLPAPEGPSLPPRHLFLTFEDLVSLRMIVALRQAGFSLQHVRQVHKWLQEVTGYPRPFVTKDLWVSDTDIFAKMNERLLSASRHGQYAMETVKEWLRALHRPNALLDMTFKKSNGHFLASSWTSHPYVVLSPDIQFGAPCIENTRIPTRAVWSMVRGGDSVAFLAKSYGIPLVKLQSALEWEEKLARAAA